MPLLRGYWAVGNYSLRCMAVTAGLKVPGPEKRLEPWSSQILGHSSTSANRGRSENRIWACGMELALGCAWERGELWLGHLGRRESLACWAGILTWWRPWLGALRGLLREISGGSLGKGLFHCSPWQIPMKRDSPWF